MKFNGLWIGLLLCMVCLSVPGCSKPRKTFDERLSEIKNDKTLSNDQVIEAYGNLCFLLQDIKTTTKGKEITTEVVFHGYNESKLANMQIEPAGGVGNLMQMAQMDKLFEDLDEFIPLATERGVTTIVATLQTPIYRGSDVEEWVDTYRIRLNAKQMAAFVKTKSLSLEKRQKMAPSFWKIELDRFKEFTYERQ